LILGLAVVTGCSDSPSNETVITFNLCGNVCAHGGNQGVDFVADLARTSHAEFLLLQEVCRAQADALKRALPAFHMTYVSTYRGDAGGLNECPGDDIGLAVASARPIDRSFTVPLPNPGLGGRQLEERRVACVQLRSGEIACTTHLVRRENDPDAHRAQVNALPGVIAELLRRNSVVVFGGDFNDDIARLPIIDESFLVGAKGVDFVLAGRSAFDRSFASSKPCSCSDHDALVVMLSR